MTRVLAVIGVVCGVLPACYVSAADISASEPALFSSSAELALAPGSEPPKITNSFSDTLLPSDPQPESIWEDKIGDGFRHTVQTISLEAGGAAGIQIFGGRRKHDLGLTSLSYGHMWGDVVAKDHWYRGNWEIRGELFGGVQFSPSSGKWLVGLAPHLRYNFATGTRWIPFIDAGAGVSAAKIGPPDLSGTFEFNLQAGTGIQWFVRKDMAITIEVGYLHVSSAGISDPNQGLNAVKAMGGFTWFF